MPTTAHFKLRRKQFLAAIDTPVLLMAGDWIPRNYPANPGPFRADSTFLFLFPDPEPNAAALFDPKDKSVTLFLNERTAADALWHGPSSSFAAVKRAIGVTRVAKRSDLSGVAKRQLGRRRARTLAVADPRATAEAREICGDKVDFADASRIGDPDLLLAVAKLRNHRLPEEVKEMRLAARITRDAHKTAMAHTRPGVHEQELYGHVEGTFAKHGCVQAYGTILSVRGEVLHNHDHSNEVRRGDLVLLDAGAELPSGYCGDVTRTWPANGRFNASQRDIYDIVLAAEETAIAMIKPGVRYGDLHFTAARVIADGLTQLGLMRGSADDLVESGAHAVFFPHGLGHLIGLDVHDMEGFGDLIHYPPGRTRSAQFGAAFLRLDVDMEPGMSVTVEPGIYFVPPILHDAALRKQFRGQVDFNKAERFLKMNSGRGFGGVRIEDDVMCTDRGHDVLTSDVPKERAALEALIGSAV